MAGEEQAIIPVAVKLPDWARLIRPRNGCTIKHYCCAIGKNNRLAATPRQQVRDQTGNAAPRSRRLRAGRIVVQKMTVYFIQYKWQKDIDRGALLPDEKYVAAQSIEQAIALLREWVSRQTRAKSDTVSIFSVDTRFTVIVP